MQKVSVTMPGYMGKSWTVEGEAEGGLILHKMGQSWCISHIVTGQRLGNGRALKRDALAKMRALLDMGADWTCDHVEAIAASAGQEPRPFLERCRALDA